MSLFSKHLSQWRNCTRCRLAGCRKQTALYRGSIPCDVLYFGEAPGISEDALGIPFCGPAGKLLDEQIKKAELEAGVECRKLWTNIVGCIPKLPDSNRKAEEPTKEEIEACSPRVEEIIGIAKPKVIVAVGLLAQKQAKAEDWCKYAKIVLVSHPAFILRITNPSQKKHEYDRVIIQLATAFREWL